MATLHYGFEKFYYSDGTDTVKVGHILEEAYGIVGHFMEFHKDLIEEYIHEALADSENLDVEEADLHKIEELFVQFLDSRELEKLGIPGIPTRASRSVVKVQSYMRAGIQVKGYKRRGKSLRPSFVNTGLYRDSFRVWLERF